MADNLGPNQTRVLDPSNRSFESVVYQRRKPPLSSEVNLTSVLAANHAQDVAKAGMKSGWAVRGTIRDTVSENSCAAGDVICSPSYAANSFKLIALDQGVEAQRLVAWVNGWKVVVQGTFATDENNLITRYTPPWLPPSTTTRVDFVFLEVWRRIVDVTDTVYKHGNVDYGGINPTNDLIDPAAGIETSVRIQLQYRIRVVDQVRINVYPDGFDPAAVYAQGPLSVPLSCSLAAFQPVAGDSGLWRAGLGDSASQDTLGTVDGYVYAIPMFAISRRNVNDYDYNSMANGAGKSLANYLSGVASDRPDNLYNDWIVADDILDLRRLAQVDTQVAVTDAFDRLTTGRMRGVMAQSSLGGNHFGPILTNADAVSYNDQPGSTWINLSTPVVPTGQTDSTGVRRVFSNAIVDQPDTFVVRTTSQKSSGTIGGVWALNDQVQIFTPLPYFPSGTTIVSVDSIYKASGSLLLSLFTISGLNSPVVTIAVGAGATSLIGTSDSITIQYTIRYANGANGFTMLPETFLEARREDSTCAIALTSVGVRDHAAAPVVTTDGTKFNMVYNKGGLGYEQYDFGHQMVYHLIGNGVVQFTVPRTINGYTILGIVGVSVSGVDVTPIQIERATDPSVYTITMGSAVTAGADVAVTLYTGTKFFAVNRQGRAITDTLEMYETSITSTGSASYTIDTVSKAVLALASNVSSDGAGIAYVNGYQKILSTNNAGLPTDTTKTRATIMFNSSDIPSAGAIIEVPLLTKSNISSSEGFTFFYRAVPYQGTMDATAIGKVLAAGPALVTTAGSGAITDYTYATGAAVFSHDSTVVSGIGTAWTSAARVGYTIKPASSSCEFRIAQIYSDTMLFISDPDTSSNSGPMGESYVITGRDYPIHPSANIVDRLPTLDATTDCMCLGENITTAVSDPYPVLSTRVISAPQNAEGKNVVLGGMGTASRGRKGVQIENASYGKGTIGLKFERLDTTGAWQKTYQSYAFDKDGSGNLYMMVVASESDCAGRSRYFDEMAAQETVDLFRI